MACAVQSSFTREAELDISAFSSWADGMWKVTLVNEGGQSRIGWPVVKNGKVETKWIHGPDVLSVIKAAMGIDKTNV